MSAAARPSTAMHSVDAHPDYSCGAQADSARMQSRLAPREESNRGHSAGMCVPRLGPAPARLSPGTTSAEASVPSATAAEANKDGGRWNWGWGNISPEVRPEGGQGRPCARNDIACCCCCCWECRTGRRAGWGAGAAWDSDGVSRRTPEMLDRDGREGLTRGEICRVPPVRGTAGPGRPGRIGAALVLVDDARPSGCRVGRPVVVSLLRALSTWLQSLFLLLFHHLRLASLPSSSQRWSWCPVPSPASPSTGAHPLRRPAPPHARPALDRPLPARLAHHARSVNTHDLPLLPLHHPLPALTLTLTLAYASLPNPSTVHSTVSIPIPSIPSPIRSTHTTQPTPTPHAYASPTPLTHHSTYTMFPACETRIDKKYGKWGRVLGKGTGGTVRLIQGPPRLGGKVFAVKEFRKKKGKETDFEYRRMITAECCFANGLKHVNVIETVDIVRNKSRYFQVMEYAPYDLFSVVMSGRMVQPEIYCVFRQICDGVAYLHSTGLAHRDLKLENCVMTNGNVVKLIDFGTATPSYHPDKGVILSSGLVGSDPYVAPEVFRGEMYDARKADVWSLGIIFLSMMLRRFPWALADPRKDLNYRKFATTLHELPARPASPRKAASATLAPSTTGATTSSTEPAPRKPKAQKSGESMVESSASSAYEVPSLFGFGASGGGLSLTTFATRDSSLVLTPSDTSASRASRTTDEQNWVDPYLEKYENWEAVIERLCAEREEESSAGSSARSSRSSVRAPKSVPSSTRLSSFIQSPAPAWVPNGSGSGSGNGSTSESAAGSGVASSSASTRAPTAHVAAMSALAHGNGLAPQNQIRHEASEPMLSTLARPSPALLSTNRRARPPILATVSDNVLCDTLHTSPIASSPPAASAAAPTPASGGPGPVSAHSFASEPTLISGLYPAQGLSKLYDAAPSPTPAGRIVISPDNTLSYLPHETRWTILRMLQIEPASRCSMADILCCPPQSQQQQQQALPPSPPQSPPRSSAASTHEGQAHAHLPHQLPSALQMTPAKRAATMPAGAGAGAGAGTIGRKRGDRDPGIEELGRDWLRNIVPCSDTDCECATHIHVRLKPSTKAGVVSGNGKWWKRS